jgi:short-subunit dehydrogenase involved in D-alanine esterification of teichoic acids
LYSSTKAALWSFTRSLRRKHGNEMQVVEVIPSPFLSNIGAHKLVIGEQTSQKIIPKKSFISTIASKLESSSKLNSENVANTILLKENKGEEIIFIPFLAKLVSIKESLRYCQ